MLSPNGVVFVGDLGRKLSSPAVFGVSVARGVDSVLARCAFALARSAIQLGWLFLDGVGFGDSGRDIELSSQLDLFGLHRFEGLPGDCGTVWPSSLAL